MKTSTALSGEGPYDNRQLGLPAAYVALAVLLLNLSLRSHGLLVSFRPVNRERDIDCSSL